jgi:hypothetical protein
MSSRMQSAVTNPGMGGRAGDRNQCQGRADAGELLVAELAARRARLRELLGLVQREVAREMALQATSRMPCRRVPKPPLGAAS